MSPDAAVLLAALLTLACIDNVHAASSRILSVHLSDNIETEWAYTTGSHQFVYVFAGGANQTYSFNPDAQSIDFITHIPDASPTPYCVTIRPGDAVWPTHHYFNVESVLKAMGMNVDNRGWAGIYYKYGNGCPLNCDWSELQKSHSILVTAPTPSPTTASPSMPSLSPSWSPTQSPTATPTFSPSTNPSRSPTLSPIPVPTASPTQQPTAMPSTEPTMNPTANPTVPTIEPTLHPTSNPTPSPSDHPSVSPTPQPSSSPTLTPTRYPTSEPTSNPTLNPSISPTNHPSISPTDSPSAAPTYYMNPYCPMTHALASMSSANLASTEFAECHTNDPAFSGYAGGSTAIDVAGKLTCDTLMSCCLCQWIYCGGSGHGCDRLILGASAAIGVPNIYIQSRSAVAEFIPGAASLQPGASFYCDGAESCKSTSIDGRYISTAHCLGDYGCQDSHIRIEPAQNMIFKCGGSLSCANTRVFIEIAPRSRVSVIESIELVGIQSAQSAVITIRNLSPKPVLVKNVECSVGACQSTQFVVEGQVFFQNCNLPDFAMLPVGVSSLPDAMLACAGYSTYGWQQRVPPQPYFLFH